jgi:hypothetical protein
MKNVLNNALILLFIASVASAQTPEFTTLCSSGNYIFAGVKNESMDWGMRSYLLQVSWESLTSSKVILPKEISDREIRALFPAKNNILIVMSQWTIEQGDNPQFYSYNSKTKEWKKLGETDCISFDKVKVERESLIFSCFEINKEGKEIEFQKKVTLKGIRLTQSGEFNLPIIKIKKGSMRAELNGETFKWKKLKVNVSKKEKCFEP